MDLPVGDFNPTQTITLWHSKSKNGIQIINSKKDAVNCQSSLSYTVLYNSGRFKNDEEVEFKYIVIFLTILFAIFLTYIYCS